MDKPLRVVYRYTMGFVYRQATKEARQRCIRAMREIGQKWRDDPEIDYVCYYAAGGGDGLDGFGNHFVFDIGDVAKADMMNNDVLSNEDLLLQKYSIEVVFGNPAIDQVFAT